jgi:hypothetical protein
MGTQSPTYGREKRKTPYNCQKLKKNAQVKDASNFFVLREKKSF